MTCRYKIFIYPKGPQGLYFAELTTKSGMNFGYYVVSYQHAITLGRIMAEIDLHESQQTII